MNTVAAWRPMRADDVPGVALLAKIAFPTLPEDDAVFAERQRLYPTGCWVIGAAGGLSGYLITYPWLRLSPPKLNLQIGQLPAAPDCLYIHDMVVHPHLRGQGLARLIIDQVLRDAPLAGFETVALVAVNRAAPFWQSFGFEPHVVAALASYGEDAAYMELAVAAGGAGEATASAL